MNGRSMLLVAAGLALLGSPVLARPGYWGTPMWGQSAMGYSGFADRDGPDQRVGKVTAARFVAHDVDAAALRAGPIAVGSATGTMADQRESGAYRAAVSAALARAGVAPAAAGGGPSPIAEINVVHSLVQPEGPRHRPVSGEAEVGVGNRGSYSSLGIDIDLSKPTKALVSTRLEAQILDPGSRKILWEGRADIVTPEGDRRWSNDRIAARLADELFRDFPTRAERS